MAVHRDGPRLTQPTIDGLEVRSWHVGRLRRRGAVRMGGGGARQQGGGDRGDGDGGAESGVRCHGWLR
jgi:hypothetical protein